MSSELLLFWGGLWAVMNVRGGWGTFWKFLRTWLITLAFTIWNNRKVLIVWCTLRSQHTLFFNTVCTIYFFYGVKVSDLAVIYNLENSKVTRNYSCLESSPSKTSLFNYKSGDMCLFDSFCFHFFHLMTTRKLCYSWKKDSASIQYICPSHLCSKTSGQDCSQNSGAGESSGVAATWSEDESNRGAEGLKTAQLPAAGLSMTWHSFFVSSIHLLKKAIHRTM